MCFQVSLWIEIIRGLAGGAARSQGRGAYEYVHQWLWCPMIPSLSLPKSSVLCFALREVGNLHYIRAKACREKHDVSVCLHFTGLEKENRILLAIAIGFESDCVNSYILFF